jgi:pimeloyl-ACP methyl ester carboxylesterase
LNDFRTYGRPPFRAAVIHGGPGAAGEMAPVARELASNRGVLEPLQTAASVTGQVEELKATLEEKGNLPITLIGYSWGAWLGFLVAAHHPSLVRKLVLIGSGPFEEKYVARVQETRLSRLSEDERKEYRSVLARLSDARAQSQDASLERLGELASKADSWDPLRGEPEAIAFQAEIHHRVWQDAVEMRRSGRLLGFARQVRCPVVAIHGDYDPHPAEGVQEPLSAALQDFRFHLLEHCGHTPWMEKQARETFYKIVNDELESELRRKIPLPSG